MVALIFIPTYLITYFKTISFNTIIHVPYHLAGHIHFQLRDLLPLQFLTYFIHIHDNR